MAGGKGASAKKEGAAQQIEGIGADSVGPQVGGPAPKEISRADRVMDHLVKRYLLNIEVPVIEEISLIIKDKRKEKMTETPKPRRNAFRCHRSRRPVGRRE